MDAEASPQGWVYGGLKVIGLNSELAYFINFDPLFFTRFTHLVVSSLNFLSFFLGHLHHLFRQTFGH